jgi:hypothetical protein
MWLRDFLPQDLENLRIMTYGYNSSLKDLKKASEETMVDYRREFITALEDVRGTEEVRKPSVFITVGDLTRGL